MPYEDDEEPKPECPICYAEVSHFMFDEHMDEHGSRRRCSFCGANLSENEYCYHNK